MMFGLTESTTIALVYGAITNDPDHDTTAGILVGTLVISIYSLQSHPGQPIPRVVEPVLDTI